MREEHGMNCERLEERISALEAEVELLKRANVLWGKKWVACGDSFTEGDFTGFVDDQGLSGKESPVIYDMNRKMYKTYPWCVAERNHMTLINEAKCGTIMPLDKTHVDDPAHVPETTRNPFSLNRYLAIDPDADYITLLFGINDSVHTHLGTLEDETNETFYGAWNVVLRHLISHHPFAKIGIIVTCGGEKEYRQALRDVACKWGIPMLDLTNDPKVPLTMYREEGLGLSMEAGEMRYHSFLVSAKNRHPSLKAHEYLSTFVENFLRSL